MSIHDMKRPILVMPEEWEGMKAEIVQLRHDLNVAAELLWRTSAELRYIKSKVAPDE